MYCDKEYLNEKPEVVKILMDTALNFSKLSKCAAKKVCCILYKDGNIISLGINGTSPGTVNCEDKFRKINGEWYTKDPFDPCASWKLCDSEDHHIWSSYNEIHAETNAISKALVNVENSVAILTHSPCWNCAKMFVAFKISKIYFKYEYDDFENVYEFLKMQNIEMIKV